MDSVFADMRAASNATLVAAEKMRCHINNQAALIRSDQGIIQAHKATILMLNKKIQEQKTALDTQKAYFALRTRMLQKKIDFLLADENRASKKVIKIQGNAIRVLWKGKNTMDTAYWSLETKARKENSENALEGSTRKKFPKGKPSFYKYAPVAADSEMGLALLYGNGSGHSELNTAGPSSRQDGTSSRAAVNTSAPNPPVTAQELELMWQEFSSIFSGDITPSASAPTAQPLPLPPAILGATAMPVATSSATTTSTQVNIGLGITSKANPVVGLDSPSSRKRGRVQSPERSTDRPSGGINANGTISGANKGSNTTSSAGVPSNAPPNSTAAAPLRSNSSSRAAVNSSADTISPPGRAVSAFIPLEGAANAVLRTWHLKTDGPLRQYMIEGMLSRMKDTQEKQSHLWPARREGCRKVEAQLYHGCTTRNEYLQKAQTA